MSKKLRMLVISALLVLSAVLSGTGIANISNQQALAAAVSTVWSEISIADDLYEGDTFAVPTRTVTVGENTYDASSVVTFPDGTTTTNKSIVLETAGTYSIKYTAVVSGRPRSITETFLAKYRMVRTSSPETSVEYGSHELAPSVQGLVVRLAEKDTMLFNEIIDISDNTASDILFEAFVTSDAAPTGYDFSKLYVQFTDVEDSENYFRVRYIRSSDGIKYPYTYMLAGGNGQPMSGWEGGAWNKLHVENQWGAGTKHSFYSSYNEGASTKDVGNVRINLAYDAISKTVYVNGAMVIDLDNPRYFSTLWDGFVSGKVRMSVWADDYLASSANFVITKAGENFDLTKTTMEETTPPKITVDTEYDKNAMPEAKVGMSYPVPTATAFDEYTGVCPVKTEVYYNYTNAAGATNVNLVDGKFDVDYVGDYAIVYTAKDYMGNTAQEIYWLNASTTLSKPTISLMGAIPETMNAGELINLPTYSVTGGSGVSTVKVYANDGSGDVELPDGTFRPNAVCVHKIKYVATDYIGQESTLELSVTVNGGSAPVFVEVPSLPKYLFAGYNYVLPELYANDYTSGTLVRQLATVTVMDANGTNTVAAGATYVPEVANNMDMVTITYTAGTTTYSVEIPTVKAKDANGLNMANYFVMDGAIIAAQDENALITATDADAKWTFANKLVAEELSVVLKANPSASNYSGYKFTLTDSEDPSIAITAQITKSGDKSMMLTDAFAIDVEIGFTTGSVSNQFDLGYKNGNFTINGTGVGVKKTNAGEAFKGFPSNFVYVTVEMIDASAGSNYSVVSVNSQPISNLTLDFVGPKIAVLGERGGTKSYGSKVVLPAALAGDVFDVSISFTVTVKNPTGDIISSTSGLELNKVDPTKEYEIELIGYGQFQVIYEAKDSGGSRTKIQYAINVDDEQGPQMVFAHAFQATAKVGDVLIIPDFSVSDNYCAVEEIVVSKYCLTPTGFLIVMPDNSNAVKAQYVGTYVFRVIATDAAGNKTMCRMSITVTE